MSTLNAITSLCEQICNDIYADQCKYLAHRIALLYVRILEGDLFAVSRPLANDGLSDHSFDVYSGDIDFTRLSSIH